MKRTVKIDCMPDLLAMQTTKEKKSETQMTVSSDAFLSDAVFEDFEFNQRTSIRDVFAKLITGAITKDEGAKAEAPCS